MKDSSLVDKTCFRTAFLVIVTDLDIKSLGRVISEKLAGGLPFRGLEEHIRDEIPAIYINNLLGCRLILQGFPGEDGYNLVLEEQSFPHRIFEEAKKSSTTVDFSGNLYVLLQSIEGISVFLE